MAPPWEKPATTMRSAGIPRSRSRRTQRAERRRRVADAGLVLGGAAVEARDVVPRAHAVAAVDRHRADRGVREHETDGGRRLEPQLRHQRLEVVAVGAEPVHPQHGGVGGFPRLDLDRLERRRAHAPEAAGRGATGSSCWSSIRAIDGCGTAPICWSTTWPPLKTSSVGIERTPKA